MSIYTEKISKKDQSEMEPNRIYNSQYHNELNKLVLEYRQLIKGKPKWYIMDELKKDSVCISLRLQGLQEIQEKNKIKKY